MFGFGYQGHHGQNLPAHAAAPAAVGGNQPTSGMFLKAVMADADYFLSVLDGNVLLAPSNPHDGHQDSFKYMRFSTPIKDDEGNPAFFLVNKANYLAVENTFGQFHPMKLVPFNPAYLEESLMWTDVGEGFRFIRPLNNTRLNFGDKDHGGVHDVTAVVLWKISPWGKEAYANGPCGGSPGHTVRIFCKAGEDFSATARKGTVVLEPTDPRDECQHWFKDMRHSNCIEDEEGYPAFALVNKFTGKAIKHSQGEGHPVKLVKYNPNNPDESVLWTESRDVGGGFRRIRAVNNVRLGFGLKFNKVHGGVHYGTTVVLWEGKKGYLKGHKVAGEATKRPRCDGPPRDHYCPDCFLKRLAELLYLN